MLGHSFDRVPGSKSCLETINGGVGAGVGASLGAAHSQAADRVNGGSPEVARSILISFQSEGKKKEREERMKRQVEMNGWFPAQPSINGERCSAKASSVRLKRSASTH